MIREQAPKRCVTSWSVERRRCKRSLTKWPKLRALKPYPRTRPQKSSVKSWPRSTPAPDQIDTLGRSERAAADLGARRGVTLRPASLVSASSTPVGSPALPRALLDRLPAPRAARQPFRADRTPAAQYGSYECVVLGRDA